MSSVAQKSNSVAPPSGAGEQQRIVFDTLIRFIRNKSGESQRILQGYAGTGKTWLGVQVALMAAKLGFSVAVCAPTHKAVAVIREKINATGTTSDISFIGTLHSLLGLRLKEGYNAKMSLTLHRRKGKRYFEDFDVVVVDEASMTGLELLKHIKTSQSKTQTKVLFVGDPGQLLPVEDKEENTVSADLLQIVPPVFQTVQHGDELTQIIRQKSTGHAHPIVEFAHVIRGYIEGDVTGVFHPYAVRDYLLEHKADLHGKVRLAHVNRVAPGTASLRRFFPGKDIRAIAWRNKVVDRHNALIHAELPDLYDARDNDALFWPGETLVAREAIYAFKEEAQMAFRSKREWEDELSPDPEEDTKTKKGRGKEKAVIVQNNTELTVVSCKGIEHPYLGIPSWKIRAILPETGDRVEIYAARNPQTHRQMTNAAWAEVKTQTGNRTKGFCHAWAVTRACAPIAHGYAMTSHKSQGSTFFCSIIDLPDLYAMSRMPGGIDAYHRALYVAVTRASDMVWMCI